MRALLVGDMHAVPEELDDCNKVIQLILELALADDRLRDVWFLGDQHHTHAVMRLEVLHWWRTAFKALTQQGLRVTCLVGNHDQASPGSNIHAMAAYGGSGVTVVDKPTVVSGVLLLPYYHNQDEFLAACREYSMREPPPPGWIRTDPDPVRSRTVVCHQTFDGSTYENGFPASDGFDPNLVPQELIISGHIHTAQEYGKVWYPGAPRWRSLNDANVERAVWKVEFEKNGQLVDRLPFGTGAVCRRIFHMDDTPEKPVELPLNPQHQWRIDIKGPPAWCQERKGLLQAAGARIRTFPTRTGAANRVRESEGVDRAFKKFLEHYQPKHGTSIEVLSGLVKERLSL